MKKLLPRSCRRAIAISLAVFSALPVFGRMIDPRGYSFPPYFVFDGVDAVGHVLYVKRIGEIKWTDDSFPVVVRWNSGDKGTSAILGAGWSLPIAESRIVPIDANRFVMRQPDGCERRFSRNPKKPNEIQSGVHRWLGRISGDRIDIWTHPDAPGEKVETRMRFQSGRLTELRMQGAVLAFKYDKGVLAQVDVDGKRQLRVSRSTRRPNEWNFEFADKRLVTAVSGTATLPTDSGMRKGETLKELRFGGAETNVFAYSATKDGRMVFSAPGTSVVWDAKRRTILESGEWKYEIGEAKPVGNNTPMRRVNRDGGVEQDFEDLETGFVVKETVGGEKRIERRFTSGRPVGASIIGKVSLITESSFHMMTWGAWCIRDTDTGLRTWSTKASANSGLMIGIRSSEFARTRIGRQIGSTSIRRTGLTSAWCVESELSVRRWRISTSS